MMVGRKKRRQTVLVLSLVYGVRKVNRMMSINVYVLRIINSSFTPRNSFIPDASLGEPQKNKITFRSQNEPRLDRFARPLVVIFPPRVRLVLTIRSRLPCLAMSKPCLLG